MSKYLSPYYLSFFLLNQGYKIYFCSINKNIPEPHDAINIKSSNDLYVILVNSKNYGLD